jgi:LuxR family transcriptional regulator, quorum-sensing system regulator SdiA
MSLTQLNQRETEIMKLVSEGNAYKEIARTLGLSLPTVKCYIRSAKDKLGAKSTSHATSLFVRTALG